MVGIGIFLMTLHVFNAYRTEEKKNAANSITSSSTEIVIKSSTGNTVEQINHWIYTNILTGRLATDMEMRLRQDLLRHRLALLPNFIKFDALPKWQPLPSADVPSQEQLRIYLAMFPANYFGKNEQAQDEFRQHILKRLVKVAKTRSAL